MSTPKKITFNTISYEVVSDSSPLPVSIPDSEGKCEAIYYACPCGWRGHVESSEKDPCPVCFPKS